MIHIFKRCKLFYVYTNMTYLYLLIWQSQKRRLHQIQYMDWGTILNLLLKNRSSNHNVKIITFLFFNYATLICREVYHLAIFHSKTWACLKHTSSLLNFQSTHDFASHPRLLIHNPGNKKCQKCPAGLLNIHTIQNLSLPSKNFNFYSLQSHFVLNMYLSFSFCKFFKKTKELLSTME